MNVNDLFGFDHFPKFQSSSQKLKEQPKRTLRNQIATREELAELGKKLAAEHKVKTGLSNDRTLYKKLRSNCADIESTYVTLTETARKKEAITPGAEWLLDNYHIIEKQINDIKNHFPRGYDKSLPRLLEGEHASFPRVYHIALEFIANTDSVLDIVLLNAFLEGYQTVATLTIGEVWAVPIMLRFALLDNLRNLSVSMLRAKDELKAAEMLIEEILGDETKPGTQILLNLAEKVMLRPDFLSLGAGHLIRRLRDRGRKASLTLQWLEERLREEGREPEEILKLEQRIQAADQISIGNIFTSLRSIGYVDWESWFESTCRIEHILRLDPGGLYPKCDFKTRDNYRHYVERISRYTRHSETEVAVAAVSLAREYEARIKQNKSSEAERARHASVGAYLSDRGLEELEKTLLYTPTLPQKILRGIKKNPTPLYFAGIVLFSCLPYFWAIQHSISYFAEVWQLIVVGLLLLVPSIDLGNNITQWIATRLSTPYILPKLDFDQGIPEDCISGVIVHSLFTDTDAAKKTIEGMLVRYLSNEDENLIYVILADLADAATEETENDQKIMQFAQNSVAALNHQYGIDKFFVLFRKRLWNEKEGCFMAWERKRGKIEEFNQLILGNDKTSFIVTEDQKSVLRQIKYVITLDNDTQLPRGTARKLIASIAHPANFPIFDPKLGIVRDGYSIIQPRVGVSLTSANTSTFAQIFSGNAGLDPYTQSVSDVYQDLFHEGSYIGKGVYNLKAFEEALNNRVPENALLSHDLFEGIFARVGLATDIELYDDFPSKYHVHAKRQHRWIRGDWQLLPWMRLRVPTKSGLKVPSQLPFLGLWKIFDNLRRSLVAPSVFLMLVGAFLFLPGNPLFWLVLSALVVAFPVYTNIAQALIIPPQGLSFESHFGSIWKDFAKMSKQTLLTLIFMPHQAFLATHAIVITLSRIFFTKKHLLQWETAFHAERRMQLNLKSFIGEMLWALLFTGASYLAVLYLHPTQAILASPLFGLWLISPLIARNVSTPKEFGHFELSETDRSLLERYAHNTWRYFHDYLRAEDHFLIPDNLQEVPSPVVARRTSPTNISLSMLSSVSAADFGFQSVPKTLWVVNQVFTSLSKLERYNGHFLNWYNTETAEALYPRYVSMVDSGNMVGHLISLQAAVKSFVQQPMLGKQHWNHIVGFIEDQKKSISDKSHAELSLLKGAFANEQRPTSIKGTSRLLKHLLRVSEECAMSSTDPLLASELSDFLNIYSFLRWVEPFETIAEQMISKDALSAAPSIKAILDELSTMDCSYENIKNLAASLKSVAADSMSASYFSDSVGTLLKEELAKLDESLKQTGNDISSIEEKAAGIISSMDFGFLYDYSKDLFAIGYNVDAARRDNSYYDLLASEARLGSLCAIALGQLPQKHWFALGRGLTNIDGGKALLSWTGTMFEYLMPLLMMRSYPGTLLSETYNVVTAAQKSYGRRNRIPWGISESSYSGVDFEKTYQYKAFGVPGLGLKRGLEDDLVISPYSTMLALPVAPQSSIENLKRMEGDKFLGDYGFYESIDFTDHRLAPNEKCHIVRSYFAHHQGMSLAAMNNVCHNSIWQERFHSDPRIQSAELLLHEKFPERLPVLVPAQMAVSATEEREGEEEDFITQLYTTPHTAYPRTHLLSNGRYTVMVDNAGGSWSIYDKEMSLTRWREDGVSNDTGTFIFLRDLDSKRTWSTGFQPTLVEPKNYEVVFGPDKAEFKRRDFDIFSHLEITVSPEDDVEIRRLSLANLSNEKRTIEVTSFAEVSLASTRADQAHPAFAKMFVQSEYLDEHDALLFSRRPRSKHEERLYLLHMVSMRTVWDRTQYETSRENFIGRGNSIHNPAAFDSTEPLQGSVGYVLDPCLSLRVRVELQPGETQTVTFLTSFSRSRDQLLGIANRYRDMNQVSRAFEMAWSQSSIELRNERTFGKHGQTFQKLANGLLLNIEKLRSKPDVIARNRLGQSGLWRFGISGDLPICLVRITEPNQTKIVEELLQAHHYLRNRGFQFDLVIFNEHSGGYLQSAQDEIEFLIRSSFSAALVDKKGGVFLRNMTQLSEEEKDLVLSVARVSLSGLRGNLASQLKFEEPALEWIPYDPHHTPNYSLSSRHGHPDMGEFFNGTGSFDENGSCYFLKISDSSIPPAPWANVIANPKFGTVVTETGGGYTWSENSRENRLTPWSNDPVMDPLGEVVYLRDVKTGAYWCPTPRPVILESDVFVRHRFGETEFISTVEGITTTLSISVSKDDSIKWWNLHLANLTPYPRTIEVFLYVNWVLGVQKQDTYTQIVSGYDKDSSILYAQNHYNADFAGRVVFMGSSNPIDGYTTNRAEFIGRNRDVASPALLAAVSNTRKAGAKNFVRLSSKVGACFDSCGVIKVIATIEPNASEKVSFFLGEGPSFEAVHQKVSQLTSVQAATDAVAVTKSFFADSVNTVTAKTPDRSFDIMINGWLLYQTLSCRLWGRTGFYQSGGAYGFRDQLQDSSALLISNPDLVKKQILLHAGRQFPEGDVQHWWHPPTGKGVRTKISDDYLWLPLIVQRYIEMTGDLSILEERAGYIDGPVLGEHEMEAYIVPHENPHTSTIYEKCILMLDRSLHFGSHGLPFIGGGDWNDGMNEIGRHGKGESVWMGWFLGTVLKRFIPFVEGRKDSVRAEIYRTKIAELQNALEQNAWDGEWYRRAYFDDGSPVGSKECEECKIDSLPQSWSIISGLGTPERSKLAMSKVYEHLVDTKYGLIKLFTPPFNTSEQEPGYIKGYLPGIRENGGQYTHASAWVIIAAALMGDGDKAFDLFKLINPIQHTDTAEHARLYRGEPYVLCGDVYASAPYEGRAGWSWYTGSSGWMYQAGIEYILGLKMRGDYFTIDPCIPREWPHYELRLKKNGVEYIVKVENPQKTGHGVKSITVSGNPTQDGKVFFTDSADIREIEVRVVLGS